MAVNDILVHLNNSRRSLVRLDVACSLARRHGAHLTALYAVEVEPSASVYGNSGGLVDADTIVEMAGAALTQAKEEASLMEWRFRERLRRDDIRGEWQFAEGPMPETFATYARYADLAVVGQVSDDGPASDNDLPGDAILATGRPILVVPHAGDFPEVGQRILVGWKDCREAAHALNDAIPLMRLTSAVKIIAINPDAKTTGNDNLSVLRVAQHLARHGVRAEASYTVAKSITDGDSLLNAAADMGADLIVVGGYGRSRMRESIFGGVTHTLLSSMTVPVLFSH